ncbi:unnamed protein product [Paramecium sonneborni]|uniref:Uncharacterized protein n=1 Tax=Paramecium sonneborni TaxID=65129 RepID=A0A8S1RPW4_9CILI|nr:unnamed protein product [Paramecium sonneborni]
MIISKILNSKFLFLKSNLIEILFQSKFNNINKKQKCQLSHSLLFKFISQALLALAKQLYHNNIYILKIKNPQSSLGIDIKKKCKYKQSNCDSLDKGWARS